MLEKVVQAVRTEAQKNPVMEDLCHDFVSRERTLRDGELNLDAQIRRMEKAKFEHGEREYARAIQFLAEAGLGTLVKSDNGKVYGLKHIGVDIKSFGKAVLEGKGEVKESPKRNIYAKLPNTEQPKQEEPKVLLPNLNKPDMVELTVKINGKDCLVIAPATMTVKEIADRFAKIA